MIVLTSLHDQALEIEEGAKDEGEGEGDEEIERTKNEIKKRVKIRQNEPMKTDSMASSINSFAEERQSKYFQKIEDSKANKVGNKVNINATQNKAASRTPLKSIQQSVSENIDSVVTMPPKTAKVNPHFGNKYLFDSAQVVPSIFKLPEFKNQSKITINRRPNAYFSDMSDLKCKVSSPESKSQTRYHKYYNSLTDSK